LYVIAPPKSKNPRSFVFICAGEWAFPTI